MGCIYHHQHFSNKYYLPPSFFRLVWFTTDIFWQIFFTANVFLTSFFFDWAFSSWCYCSPPTFFGEFISFFIQWAFYSLRSPPLTLPCCVMTIFAVTMIVASNHFCFLAAVPLSKLVFFLIATLSSTHFCSSVAISDHFPQYWLMLHMFQLERDVKDLIWKDSILKSYPMLSFSGSYEDQKGK